MISAPHTSWRIVFRTDASIQIGTGHVMRCLTLADALRVRGAESLFICRPHMGHLLELIAQRGHHVIALPALPVTDSTPASDPAHAHWLGTDWARDAEDTRTALAAEPMADWLVVDHYALDQRWERALRPTCRHLMVMDDLADRPHACDLLLDPSLGRTSADYAVLLPESATLLLGPQHALLRPEFAELRAESLARRTNPQLRHLLITMGGVDKDNATGRLLDALDACPLPPDLRITVVMGPHAPWLEHVQERAGRMHRPTHILVGVRDMARLMTDADLAIGAAGGTSWERCCLGLPSIMLVLAENQYSVATPLQNAGAAIAAQGPTEVVTFLQDHLRAGTMPDILRSLSRAAERITDGEGVSRVVRRMVAADA